MWQCQNVIRDCLPTSNFHTYRCLYWVYVGWSPELFFGIVSCYSRGATRIGFFSSGDLISWLGGGVNFTIYDIKKAIALPISPKPHEIEKCLEEKLEMGTRPGSMDQVLRGRHSENRPVISIQNVR